MAPTIPTIASTFPPDTQPPPVAPTLPTVALTIPPNTQPLPVAPPDWQYTSSPGNELLEVDDDLLPSIWSDLELTTPQAPPLPVLASPEKASLKIPGRDTASLRRLAILLARGCFLGDEVLGQTSPSGREMSALDPQKRYQIREVIRQRSRVNEMAFENLWQQCLTSVSKTCQGIRKGKIKKDTVKL